MDLLSTCGKHYAMGMALTALSACVWWSKQKVKIQPIVSLAFINIAKKAETSHILYKKTLEICVYLH